MPEDPYQQATARLWIDYINKDVVPAFFRLLQAQPSEPEKQVSTLVEFKKVLSVISKEVKGPYFFGEQFSLVDAALAPWAVRDFIVGTFRGFVREDVQGWSDWAAALETRDSVVRTTSVSADCFLHKPKIWTLIFLSNIRLKMKWSNSTAHFFETNSIV